jgi:predicted nucleotide-binding protein (sugar kinase/HSP70/actin superfamily)
LNVKILECNITGSLLHKLYARYKPYETSSGETDDLLETCIAILFEDIDKGASLRKSLRKIAELFKTLRARLPQNLKRLPLVALLGDLYIKYNPLINQDLIKMVINNGCELILPSITESTLQIMDADTYQHGFDSKFLRGARMFERRYEMIVAELLDEHIEPDIESCRHALLSYGIDHYLPGETSLNLGRALYYLDNKMLDAIIHVNPIFCCPGVVSSSIFRKIQKDYSIPVIDIFYDGTGNPNQTVVPHLHYLRANKNPQVVF